MGNSASSPDDRLRITAARLAMWGELEALQSHLRAHPDLPLDFALTSAQCDAKELKWVDQETLLFPTGSTMLHVATTHGRLFVIGFLVQSPVGPRLLKTQDEFGSTALIRAVIHNQLPALRALLEAGADINAVNNYKCTALHFASAAGRTEMVSALLRAGADPSLVDSKGKTAEMCKSDDWPSDPSKCPFRNFQNEKHHLTEQEERKKAMMEAGMAASKAVAFRLAKLALVGAPSVAAGSPPLIERSSLESLLYETLSCHPVVFFLAADGGDADAAGHYQVQLSDFLLPMLKPFLDEAPQAIADEVKRGLASFLQTQKERAKQNELLQRQIDTTEKQLVALAAAPSGSSPPHSSSGADWAKRFKVAAGVWSVASKIIH